MASSIAVTHYSDPGCPWAYSAWPALTTLQWRYGDQLQWRLVMIGLAETAERYLKSGYTPTRQVVGYQRFARDYGMPFGAVPKERICFTGLACRAVVATRLTQPEHEIAVFRALQFGQFVHAQLFDGDAGIRLALDSVPGLDADLVMAELRSDATEAAYEQDRAQTRTAAGSPTEFQGRAAQTDGPVRFTAPSLQFTRTGDAAMLEAGGFQHIDAYDVCIANLDTSLTRRAAPEDVVELLQAFGHPLTTAEVAHAFAPHLVIPDLALTTSKLLEAVGAGRARVTTLGNSALWSAA